MGLDAVHRVGGDGFKTQIFGHGVHDGLRDAVRPDMSVNVHAHILGLSLWFFVGWAAGGGNPPNPPLRKGG